MTCWDEEQPRTRPADADAPAAVLELARDLADRLARARMGERDEATLRLARAMALNIVDLLEGFSRP